MKAPSAEEVLALVNAATGPDGTLDPTMQHLLMQMQEQHALNQAQLRAQAQTQRTHSEVELNVSEQPTTVKSENGHGTTSTAIDLMPLSAAAVAIGPPTNSALEKATSEVEVASGPAQATAGPPSASATLTSKAMTRKSIPLSMKKEAIQWIMGPGKGIPSRAEKHFGALNWDVSASSFRKWWKNRDKILGDSGGKKRISGGGRKPYLEDSEEKLLVVVIQERAKKDRVTRKWIAKTAQHMFQRSDSTFKASENWVTKFIRRNGLTLKRSYVTYEPQQAKLELQHQSGASGQTSTTGTNIVV
ncbi:hypothetical protein PI124_g10520 [Phytophthora idaei]|nr:hypothetical protein PI125_g8599 [Phytophthora idaei]KAG3244727.1 hypothetical protein PI124_g10520 [Phytophthora idaei]